MSTIEEVRRLILKTIGSSTSSSKKRSSPDGASSSFKVKKLRKLVLLSLQTDEDDKGAKKTFKKAVQELEADQKLTLGSDGVITLRKSEEDTKKNKKSKKKKKKETKVKREKDDDDDEAKSHKRRKHDDDDNDETIKNEEEDEGSIKNEEGDDTVVDTGNNTKKKKPCPGNPNGETRLFLGNLPFAVNDASLRDFLKPAITTHVKWITDSETGQFYGSAFIEVEGTRDGAIATTEKNGQSLLGRPIKINYAPAREGDVWPPRTAVVTGGKGQAGGSGVKAMSEKPENCVKLFVGNLSYEIDDDIIVKFFGNVGAEVKAARWLHHKDSGDFKGCGYVEFWNTEACEKGAVLNGKNLLGRPIRIDWTD